MVQPLWSTIWRFLKKLKPELPYDSAVPLMGIYLEKNMVRKDNLLLQQGVTKLRRRTQAESPRHSS